MDNMDNVYKCRICSRMYHDKEVVIDLLSEEAKKEQIAAKILCSLSIMITDHDPLKYICRICYGQVEVNFRFATACRINNAKYIENLSNSPSNDVVKTEYKKFMRIPLHALFSKYQFDVKGLFDAVTSFLNDNNESLSLTKHFEKFDQQFGLNNHNSVTNQFDIENDTPVGIPESSSALEVNMPCTNEPNVDTNHIDNIHNSGIDLNNRSIRPIVNTTNINHSTNASIPKKILLKTHPVITKNNIINTTSSIIHFYPNVATNNVNNAINNINQSRINRPIICKNNVIKPTRFCILSKSRLFMNRRRIETNTVQNHGSATHLNQSNVNSHSIVQNTVNNHSDSVQSNGNGQINEIGDDEVICLDDDDDDINHNDNNHNHNDNNNNGNGNNTQNLENSIHPLNQWILPRPPPPIRNTNNTNNNAKINIPRTYQRKNKNNVKRIIQLKRKVIGFNNTTPSTNNSTEEMTVTPDMPLSTSHEGSLSNQGEDNMYFDVDNEPTESLLVESETQPLLVEPETRSLLVEPETQSLLVEPETRSLLEPETRSLLVEPENRSLLVEPETRSLLVEPETQSLLVEPEIEPSRVLPDTGFHFLFSTDETVDLTTKEDNTPKKKPIIRQKKTPKPKKPVASKKQTQKISIARRNLKTNSEILRSSTSSTIEKKQTRKTYLALHNLKAKGQLLRSSTSSATEQSDTSLTKPRPKRASAINGAADLKNSGLCKLDKHIEGKNGNWAINVNPLTLPMVQCPICNVYLYSLESRKRHEVSKHSSLLESIHNPVDIAATPGNTACTRQLYLFNYLQLCVTSKNKTIAIHQLAKRTHLLKAFQTIGFKTIGSFKCNYCIYETNLVYALFAHMTSKHLNQKCDSEKKSCLFCFVCNRILTKRTTMLKHLDTCVNKPNELPTTNNSRNRFMCVHCDDEFSSLKELEDHTWGHAENI